MEDTKGARRLDLLLEDYQASLEQRRRSGPKEAVTMDMAGAGESLVEQKKIEQDIQQALKELTVLKNNWRLEEDAPAEKPAAVKDEGQENKAPLPSSCVKQESPEGEEPCCFLSAVKRWFTGR
ncbi:MAG: hypothetical protein HY747_12590 [Elusimicrobia bacterium]|nr:hypothetical protein [Elusimicrobiota bacterium]